MSSRVGFKVVESFMPTLSNRQVPLLRYGVFTPICGAAVAAARGPRLFRASTNRNQSGEKLFDSPIF
jgi:hypothetical protein